jgi:CheY-like chemotaxis protein
LSYNHNETPSSFKLFVPGLPPLPLRGRPCPSLHEGAEPRAGPARLLPPLPDAARGGSRSVADDEPLVVEFVRRALGRAGSTSSPPATGGRRLSTSTTPGHGEIALVILDLVMPRLDGLGLARDAGACGDLRAIIVSGYAPSPTSLATSSGATRFLPETLLRRRAPRGGARDARARLDENPVPPTGPSTAARAAS